MAEPPNKLFERVDATLKRHFRPPDRDRLARLLPLAPARGGPGRQWRRRFALAAGLVAALGGGWLIWAAAARLGGDPYQVQPWRSFERVWHDEAAGDMTPLWVCENDAEFQASFRERLGQPLSLGELPEGLEAVGLSYSHTLSPTTVYLLARARGEPVLVFVDRVERDLPSTPPAETHLRRWRRQVGKLVLYEVSSLEEPVLLDLLYDPMGR